MPGTQTSEKPGPGFVEPSVLGASKPLTVDPAPGPPQGMEPCRDERPRRRLMTAEEESAWGPEMDLKRESALNPARFGPAALAQYRGELIAWSPDGTRIIAHAKDEDSIYRLLDEAGEVSGLCLVQYVGDDVEVGFVGRLDAKVGSEDPERPRYCPDRAPPSPVVGKDRLAGIDARHRGCDPPHGVTSGFPWASAWNPRTVRARVPRPTSCQRGASPVHPRRSSPRG